MIDFLLEIAVSNVSISLALAIMAWAVHYTGKRPLIAHLLWLLVLAKLVTPPIVTVPVVTIPGLTDHFGLEATSTGVLASDLDGLSVTLDRGADETGSGIATAWFVAYGKSGLALLWLTGSAGLLAWSLVRIYRFNRLFKITSEVAPPKLQRVAWEIAQRLGLKATPTIYTTSARLSPMVWWIGGRVRILIPAALPREVEAGQLQWILAHELAHVRRRDHLVRWLEWLACVCFWWNPVAWWARRNLRINEEVCCDALVLSSLKPNPHNYANSLMTVIEFLASPAIRPPAVASEINSGGFLERRFRMIVSDNPIPRTPRWLVAGVLLAALTVLPLGVTYAQDHTTGIEDHFSRLGIDEGTIDRVRHHLAENGFTDRQIEQALGGMLRVVHELRAEGDDFELNPRLRVYFENDVGLTDDQIERVVGLSRRIAASAAPRNESDADKVRPRVAMALFEAGIEREKIRDIMGAMERIAAELKNEGEAFELDPRVHAYLEEQGLTDEQIELVVGLSRRIAALPPADEESEADKVRRHVAMALFEAGIEREKIRGIMGAMERIAAELNSEGEAFELNPRVQAYLEEQGLTDEQIELVVGLSRRIAAIPVDRDASDLIWRRVAGALSEAGVPRDQIRNVLAAMGRIVIEVKSEGEAFELDPGIREYLVSLLLTEEQIDLVVGLSQRVAASPALRDEARADVIWRRVAGALGEAGVPREQIRNVLGAVRRIVVGVQSKGDAFELDPRMQAHLEELGLTAEQIELVVGLSQRIAPLVDDDDRGRGDDDIRERIIRALMENGIARENVEGVMGTLRPIIGEIQREGDAFELDPEVREQLEGMDLTGEQIDFVVGLAQRLASRRD